MMWTGLMSWDDVDWTDVTNNKKDWCVAVSTIMNVRVTQNPGKLLAS